MVFFHTAFSEREELERENFSVSDLINCRKAISGAILPSPCFLRIE